MNEMVYILALTFMGGGFVGVGVAILAIEFGFTSINDGDYNA